MRALYSDAQLRALQSQINPHFLFNTLNTGVQLAMMEGADKTSYFIEQVASFFRYNIQQQKQVATIDEELGLVDNFVYIMIMSLIIGWIIPYIVLIVSGLSIIQNKFTKLNLVSNILSFLLCLSLFSPF